VVEVKRVWRHVQCYEKKKQKRRQARRRSDITGYDTGDFGNGPADAEEDKDADDDGPMEEQGEDSQEMMMGLMQQFNQLQMQHQEMQHQEEQNMLETMQHQQVQHHHRHHLGHHDGDGGDSKFSDITPSSSYHVLKTTINSNARGRSMEPGPDNGRLGTHSTLANSRTHTPVPASPGLDSNFAIKSHTIGTEKEVEFLNEGVDAFFSNLPI